MENPSIGELAKGVSSNFSKLGDLLVVSNIGLVIILAGIIWLVVVLILRISGKSYGYKIPLFLTISGVILAGLPYIYMALT